MGARYATGIVVTHAVRKGYVNPLERVQCNALTR